jgi:hypothetical protein
VRIVPADAGAIAISFPRRPGGARVFVAEGNVLVNVVADGLNPAQGERDFPEQRPCDLGKAVGLVIAAAQQEHQALVGQILDGVLLYSASELIRLAVSLTIPLADSRVRPLGATIRLHQLPKPSR